MESSSPSKWNPDEIRRFYRAFHKYGSDFPKISKMVGGGKAPEMCALLWRRHQTYLSIDKQHQSEEAFVAMVKQGGADIPLHPNEFPSSYAEGGVPHLPSAAAVDDDDDELEGAVIPPPGPSRLKHQRDQEEDDEDSLAAELVVSMASPEKMNHMGMSSGGDGGSGQRPRRTPKKHTSPIAAARTTPASAGKRSRAQARVGDDMYEYYDEGVTDSARKRRNARARLDYEEQPQLGVARRKPAPQAAEKRGIDALLALAVAGGDGEDESGAEFGREEKIRYVLSEDELEEDEDLLGVGLDDDKDEDYRAGRRQRKTPSTTPNKGKKGSGTPHITPARLIARGLLSPSALRSPAWDNKDFNLSDYPSAIDMPMLGSPHLGPNLPPEFVPSADNPMPRLRRRKTAPERQQMFISPLKSLFGRRTHNLGSGALMALGAMHSSVEDIPEDAGEVEVRIRHALSINGVKNFCISEFFYPALDRPWYLDNTMYELMLHAGIPLGTKLTRKEWNALRSCMGKPRRLSWSFLREQRAKLEAHRHRARSLYASEHPHQSLAALFPRQLVVGQKVFARHPLTRALHDGSVLTIQPDTYRIQFVRRDLGVEMIKDLDVMPAEPWENLPNATLVNMPRFAMAGRMVVGGRPLSIAALPALPAARVLASTAEPTTATALMGAARNIHGSLPDPEVMAEVATHLDKKEALLVQLRQMNDEVVSGAHDDAETGQPTAEFAQAYSAVIAKLVEVNDVLKLKLAELEVTSQSGAAFVEELAAGDVAKLPTEFLQGPITTQMLSSVALKESKKFVAVCKEKMELLRATEAQHQNADAPAPSTVEEVMPLIEGAAWTLSMLHIGAERMVPAAALTQALDSSILKVKPTSVVNAALYTEIESVINTLKQQLLS